VSRASTSAPHSTPLSIIIAGAGIGGLTLGNLLHQADSSIKVQIFERDSAVRSRKQGGTLGLKDSGGFVALRRLGRYEEIRAVSKPVTQFTVLTHQGKHLMTLHGDPQSLRVPRAKLCDVLLRELQRDIFFAMPCTGFAEKHGKPAVLFANGHEETADVVVACDGVKSVIRQQLIGDTPHYLGLSAIAGTVVVSMAHPLLAAGPLLLLGNGASLILDQEQDSIGWSLTMHTRHKELEYLSGAMLKERLLATTQRWYSPIRELVSSTNPDDITYAGGFYDKEPQQHARTGNLVLLGDAAHPMSPFRGEGANMAMADALSFTDQVRAAERSHLEEAIARYEQEMLQRTRKVVLASHQAAKAMHSRNRVSQVVRNAKLRIADKLLPLVQKAYR
jgi:2-polyprenyl-6-methoxyphenol hydroxylase-like FAD-dependent oxidoreductase